jgi:hypothetical protein
MPKLDDSLLDVLVPLVRQHGPLDLRTLARKARIASGRRDLDLVAVETLVDSCTALVERPDGRVVYLGDVLDGIVLTHRVRGSLRDRTDLWLGQGVQPFLAMACLHPLPLATGGEATLTDTADHPVLLGPPGWLPPAEPGDLVALSWADGRLAVRLVDPDELAGPAEEDAVRRLLSERCRAERWWHDDEEWARRALLIQALSVARLEDPELLSTPHAPLDQLLYDPLGPDARAHWRDVAAWRQPDCVAFSVQGMPAALDAELRRRAERYGMTFDQFVIAILGHLAWRTPFAEDLEPWEHWVPDQPDRPPASITPLRLADADPGPDAG